MRDRFRSVFSVFDRGHVKFLGSSALVQFLPLFTAPIIARLYTPADFGVYGVFYALVGIIASVSSLALTNAIISEKHEAGTVHATLVAMSAVLAVSMLLLVLVITLPKAAAVLALGPIVPSYLLWLPLTVFVQGVMACLYAWGIRMQLYSLMARNKLILGLSTAVLQISIGLGQFGAIGFIVANLCGVLLASTLLGAPFWRALRAVPHGFGLRSGWASVVEARRLVIWTVPASLVNSVGTMLPDLMINRYFGAALYGEYSLANRMVAFPLAFVSTSLTDIFRQQAAREVAETGSCRNSFNRFFLIMGVAALVILLPVILLMPFVFPVIFGEAWGNAGTLIQAVVFLLIIRFISSPLSYVWIICGHQRRNFFWQLGLLGLTLAAFVGGQLVYPDISLYDMLWIYSGLIGAWYVLCIWLSRCFAYAAIPPSQPT